MVRVGPVETCRGGFDAETARTLVLRLAAEADDPRRTIDPESLWRSWQDSCAEVAADPQLHQLVAESARLSPAGARAALETVLTGARAASGLDLLRRGWWQPRVCSPLLVVLAGTVPALASQALLPALALGRPVLFKSSRDEPWSAPALLGALASRLPAMRAGLAAVCWSGGDPTIETAVAEVAGAVWVYGATGALQSWRSRHEQVVELGPRGSIAVVDLDQHGGLEPLASALARDTVLLDQRGCLSLRGILAIGSPARATELALELRSALALGARDLPPGPALAEELGRVRAWRLSMAAAGAECFALDDLSHGGVIVDPAAEPLDTPGLRHLAIVPLADVGEATARLESLAQRLQGVALAGPQSLSLTPLLRSRGVTRLCAPGELQQPGPDWANGSMHPLDAAALDSRF